MAESFITARCSAIKSRFRANSLAGFRATIDVERSVHREHYRGVLKRLEKVGPAAPFTLPPEAVLKRVIHALESTRPRRRYPVTVPTYLFAVARRMLPAAMLDRVLARIARNENR